MARLIWNWSADDILTSDALRERWLSLLPDIRPTREGIRGQRVPARRGGVANGAQVRVTAQQVQEPVTREEVNRWPGDIRHRPTRMSNASPDAASGRPSRRPANRSRPPGPAAGAAEHRRSCARRGWYIVEREPNRVARPDLRVHSARGDSEAPIRAEHELSYRLWNHDLPCAARQIDGHQAGAAHGGQQALRPRERDVGHPAVEKVARCECIQISDRRFGVVALCHAAGVWALAFVCAHPERPGP